MKNGSGIISQDDPMFNMKNGTRIIYQVGRML